MLKLQIHTHLKEAGTDEAGRGCLAGPVVAAAVILPENFENELLDDSKKLRAKQREILRTIIEREALAYAVAFVYPEEIDRLNILRASITAMHRALEQLQVQPGHIAVDGNKFVPFHNIPHTTVVKGDGKYMHIAAASILAKTYRDDYMKKIAAEYPVYQWGKNKGYPTREHRNAIRTYGSCKYHRKSFRLLSEQLKLDL